MQLTLKMLVFLMSLEAIESMKSKRERQTETVGCEFLFRQAWMALGDMTKEQAKEEFVKYLLERCPTFRLHLEAHYVESEEQERLK